MSNISIVAIGVVLVVLTLVSNYIAYRIGRFHGYADGAYTQYYLKSAPYLMKGNKNR